MNQSTVRAVSDFEDGAIMTALDGSLADSEIHSTVFVIRRMTVVTMLSKDRLNISHEINRPPMRRRQEFCEIRPYRNARGVVLIHL